MESLGTLGTNQLLEPRLCREVATSGAPRTAEDQVWTKLQPLPVCLWLQREQRDRPKDQNSCEDRGMPAGHRHTGWEGGTGACTKGTLRSEGCGRERGNGFLGRPFSSHTEAEPRGKAWPAAFLPPYAPSPDACSLPVQHALVANAGR